MRPNNRNSNELRPISIITDFITHPEGSVLISIGETKVICNAVLKIAYHHFYADKVRDGLQLNTRCYREQLNNETSENLPAVKFLDVQWKFRD